MVLTETLFPHLWKVQQICEKRMELLMTELLTKNPEPDKEKQQLAWVAHMNSLKAQAEEILVAEMIQFVDAITSTVQKPNPILFSPAVKIDGEHPAATKEMRELLLKGLLEDEYYKQFLNDERFQAAVDKLRGSIQEETA